MFDACQPFFGRPVVDKLVRKGEDVRLGEHTAPVVYREMLLQICRDYATLPDPRTLTVEEICFFYDGVRSSLKRYTKPNE